MYIVPLLLAIPTVSVEKPDPAETALEQLTEMLAESVDSQFQSDLLTGILQGLQGRRRVAMPGPWPKAYAKLQTSPNAGVRNQALELALIFNDPAALTTLKARAQDANQSADVRQKAIQALVEIRIDDLSSFLLELMDDAVTQSVALRGLAVTDDPSVATKILAAYPSFDSRARQDALQTLASRPEWAKLLLKAIDVGTVPRRDLTAYTIRQLQSLGDKEVSALIDKGWGNVRATDADKRKLIAQYKQRLIKTLPQADPAAGRAVFEKTCANCHRLFDAGTAVGPDITGSQRHNLDYILENILDPSAVVASDYQMQILATISGRIVTGLVVEETPSALTVQTVNERLVIPIDEIEHRKQSALSLMPEGLLNNLSDQQVRDLIGYLASPQQVPLATGD